MTMDVPEIDDREELSDKEIAIRIDDLHFGDKVLFNERQEPLKVTKRNADGSVSLGEDLSGIEVKGRSARYILSSEEAMFHRDMGVVRRSINWIQKV